jgi:hypothetical protein
MVSIVMAPVETVVLPLAPLNVAVLPEPGTGLDVQFVVVPQVLLLVPVQVAFAAWAL